MFALHTRTPTDSRCVHYSQVRRRPLLHTGTPDPYMHVTNSLAIPSAPLLQGCQEYIRSKKNIRWMNGPVQTNGLKLILATQKFGALSAIWTLSHGSL